jgi:hypothetical protein
MVMPQVNKDVIPEAFHTKATFRALADAMIPYTPHQAAVLGSSQMNGAACVGLEDFIIWDLDHAFPLEIGVSHNLFSTQTAILLDEAALNLIYSGQTDSVAISTKYKKGGLFTLLSPQDRFRAISLLEKLDIPLGALPAPYTNNAGLVVMIAGILNGLPTFGYYSEWGGYGTTRSRNPNQRILEYFPLGWTQIGYPGPAYGYRDFRGYVVHPQIGRYSS